MPLVKAGTHSGVPIRMLPSLTVTPITSGSFEPPFMYTFSRMMDNTHGKTAEVSRARSSSSSAYRMCEE